MTKIFIIFALSILLTKITPNMCTVTLSYDGNNALAQQKMAELLATGLFVPAEDFQHEDEFPGLDFNDPLLFEDDSLPLPKDKTLTIEELEQLVVTDIQNICELKYAV